MLYSHVNMYELIDPTNYTHVAFCEAKCNYYTTINSALIAFGPARKLPQLLARKIHFVSLILSNVTQLF